MAILYLLFKIICSRHDFIANVTRLINEIYQQYSTMKKVCVFNVEREKRVVEKLAFKNVAKFICFVKRTEQQKKNQKQTIKSQSKAIRN